MSEDKFCLRWNDFESNIKASFGDLRESKALFDITLVCGEFYQIQAHKVILSASSPFFRHVLCNNPHNNPLIYLRGINQTDLQHILDFIYHGEVNVSQDNLNSFLAVAEDLKIKGLTQSQNDSKPSSSNTTHRMDRKTTNQQPTKSYQSQSTALIPDDDEIEEIPVRVKNEVAEDVIHGQSVAIDQEYNQVGYGGDLMEGDYEGGEAYDEMGTGLQLQDYASDKDLVSNLDAQITSMMYKAEKLWHCSICGKTSSGKTDISRHIEGTHIVNHPGFQCDVCGEKQKSRNALRIHKSSKHRILEYDPM